MDKSLVPVADIPVSVDPKILDKLESYEDFLTYYIQLDEATTAMAWFKADLLFHMWKKLGEGSIEQLSKDINQPRSTVINYVRTAKAFPPEQRDPVASFSLHFRASFADSFDDKKQEFSGEQRHAWVQKAVDEGLSTRELAEAIQRDKQKTLLEVTVLPCTHCQKDDGEIKPYVLYSPGGHMPADRFELHAICKDKIVDFIYGH